MSTYEEQRRTVQQTEALAADYRRILGVRTPLGDRVKSAIWTLVSPRLALDARMPDDLLDDVTAGLGGANDLRHRRRHIADSVRQAVRGRLSKDADLSDLETLIEAIENESEAEDRRYRARGRDEEVDRPGFEPAPPQTEDDLEDDELMGLIEQLEGKIDGQTMDRLRRAAADRRRERNTSYDRRSPFDNFDARRRGLGRDDPPDFLGKPIPGGSMVPNPSSVDRPGFGRPRPADARDRRHGWGQDAAPTGSFSSRFRFTNRAVPESQSKIPGRAGGNP